jgi:hypothetical protein
MDEFNYNEINEFCYRVFNYYNGKINKFNYPAVLFVEWSHNTRDRAGDHHEPNIIRVFPNSLIQDINEVIEDDTYAKQTTLRFLLLETIIHELYHVDQLLSFPADYLDTGYADRVEKEVELQTTIYLANNRQDILDKFGVLAIVGSNDVNLAVQHRYASYHRRRFVDHIARILQIILYVNGCKIASLEPIDNAIRKNIETCTGHIIVHVGDKVLVIQDGTYNAPIQDVNQFLFEHCFRYDFSIGGDIKVTCSTNGQLDIYINTMNRRNMCKLLNQ